MGTVMIIGAGTAIGAGLVRQFRDLKWRRVMATYWSETAQEGETASRLEGIARDYPDLEWFELSYSNTRQNEAVARCLQIGKKPGAKPVYTKDGKEDRTLNGVLDVIIVCADIDANVTLSDERGRRVLAAPLQVARHFRDCFMTYPGETEGSRVRGGKLIYLIDESPNTPDDSGGGTPLDLRALYHRQVRVHVQENMLKGHRVATLMLVVSLEPPALRNSSITVAGFAMGHWLMDAAGGEFHAKRRWATESQKVQNGGVLDARPQVRN